LTPTSRPPRNSSYIRRGTSYPTEVGVHPQRPVRVIRLVSMPMRQQRPQALHHSSGRRIWLGCRAQISRRSSSTPPATQILLPEKTPSCRRAVAYGAIFRVDLGKDLQDGQISLFFLGDHDHNSFDNLAFANEHQLLAPKTEATRFTRSSTRSTAVWAFEVKASNKAPIRFIALGRDATSIAHGEDNEPTGVFVSNGSTDPKHMLGTPEHLAHCTSFFTQQHGDNIVYEISHK